MRLDGAAPGGASLLVAVCYLRPSDPAPGEWLDRVAEDWAAALGVGVPIIMGDPHAHTRTEEDWPPGEPDLRPRLSADRARVDARGKLLLQFCQEQGIRILNGRAPGDEHGAGTSRGVTGGRSGLPTCGGLRPGQPGVLGRGAEPGGGGQRPDAPALGYWLWATGFDAPLAVTRRLWALAVRPRLCPPWL